MGEQIGINANLESKRKKCAIIANLKCFKHLYKSPINANKRVFINGKQISKRTDALSELEQMYNDLNLDDEELLDRAERRDLPKKFQIVWNRNENNNCNNNTVDKQSANYSSQMDLRADQSISDGLRQWKRRSFGTAEVLNALRDHNYDSVNCMIRSRTPPYRKSALPDIVKDDFAFRKYRSISHNQLYPSKSSLEMMYHKENNGSTNDINNRNNHLISSNYYTPYKYTDEIYKDLNHLSKASADFDDLSYRKLKQSIAANVCAPHPPFGIPNSIVCHSSTTDYLHTELDQKEKSKMRYRCKSIVPHLINDDMAFRKLRKDYINNSNSNISSKLSKSTAHLPPVPSLPHI